MARRRRAGWVGAAVALVVVLAMAATFFVVQTRRNTESARDDAARAAADGVASGWRSGDLTSAPVSGDAAAVQAGYAALVAGLGAGVVPSEVRVTAVERVKDAATASLRVTWPFGEGWTYDTTLALHGDLEAADGGRWRADFGPTVVHPDLTDGDTLRASRTVAKRADVLATDGSVLVGDQPVVLVGVQPSKATDVPGLSATLAGLLDVDGAALAKRIASAKPDAFVDVITLRRPDYDRLKPQLQPLPGTVFRESTLPLAPTREFARALLGTVGPVSAEIVEASKGRLVAGDVAGLSGLQRQYDALLGGTAGVTVSRVRGEQTSELFTVPPVDGKPLTLTLDPAVQKAADAALATAAGGNGNAALVAVDVTSGAVLAVANTPASGADRALTGRYPPGSTFKTISTQALLAAGVTPSQVVACPPTATVEGRSFRNFEGDAIGDVPFAVDFAQSCNTAFVGLSRTLSDDALQRAAAAVGLGEDWKVGTDAFTGGVPVNESGVDKAAATIGQGRVLASPLGMAVAVATIARGSWAPPSLVTDPTVAGAATAPPTPVADLGVVRELMRGVVTGGTASALADVPGEPVYAKTGTAEYGSDSPPRTHAWAIGFQGNVAFAVLVEDGASGGRVAVPVAETFLRGLG